MVLGPELASVRGIASGQLAATLGPDRAAVDDHVPCSDVGPRAHHPEQGDMDPAQHGLSTPVAQATAQGGAAGAPGGGPQLAPLHPLTNEEPQCLDNLDGWHARSSGAERPVLDLVDNP